MEKHIITSKSNHREFFGTLAASAPIGMTSLFFDQNPVAGMSAPEKTKLAGAALPPDMSMCAPLPKQ